MKKQKVGQWEISELTLGGGKLVEMPIDQGVELVECAKELGINCVDGHNRYGNAEEIFGKVKDIIKMTKISAYQFKDRYDLVDRSSKRMGNIDILWVSDLDNTKLYSYGEAMYNSVRSSYPLVGITTESPELAQSFMDVHLACDLFMVPVFQGSGMEGFIEKAKDEGKRIFAIKPFDDGRQLKKYSITDCLQYVKKLGVDVVVIGTSNIEHLKENVEIWNQI